MDLARKLREAAQRQPKVIRQLGIGMKIERKGKAIITNKSGRAKVKKEKCLKTPEIDTGKKGALSQDGARGRDDAEKEIGMCFAAVQLGSGNVFEDERGPEAQGSKWEKVSAQGLVRRGPRRGSPTVPVYASPRRRKPTCFRRSI